jgi:hypothetical protein
MSSETTGDIDFPSRPLVSKILFDPTWNLSETPLLARLLRDKQNNVFMFPVVLSSTRGTGAAATLRTADIGTIPQTLAGASGISAALLGAAALDVNAVLNYFNGSTYDVALNDATSRTVSGLASAQTVIVFIGNLHSHLSINSSAPASTATLDVQGSVDNSNFIDLYSLATNVTNQFDFVGNAPLSSTLGLPATDVSNPTTFGGAATITNALNPLAFPYVKVVAGAAGAGVATTLTITVK